MSKSYPLRFFVPSSKKERNDSIDNVSSGTLVRQDSENTTTFTDRYESGDDEHVEKALSAEMKFNMWNSVDQYDEKHVIEESKMMRLIGKLTGNDRVSLWLFGWLFGWLLVLMVVFVGLYACVCFFCLFVWFFV